MAAALGTMRIASAGRIQSVSMYASDTSTAAVTFDESKIAVAGSLPEFTVKAPGTIIDFCWTSDVATPTHFQILYNGTPTGDICDFTAHLASVVNRPNPAIPVKANDKIKLIQIA